MKHLWTLLLAFSCGALDYSNQFLINICSQNIPPELCIEYEQRGLDFTICRWRHMFPLFTKINLEDRNKIYEASMPYCEAWRENKPWAFVPDIEGNYCSDIDLSQKDQKPAALCAKYKLAHNYWQEKALAFFLEIKSLSEETGAIFLAEILRIGTEKTMLQENHANLLRLNISFPEEPESYWYKYIINQAPILFVLGILFFEKRFSTK